MIKYNDILGRSGENMSDLLANYDEQVYAAVLGKIIGVYMGRPFEGWDKAKIEEI